eukprot:8037517-Alexandrium_andersonii.AAC.1
MKPGCMKQFMWQDEVDAYGLDGPVLHLGRQSHCVWLNLVERCRLLEEAPHVTFGVSQSCALGPSVCQLP